MVGELVPRFNKAFCMDFPKKILDFFKSITIFGHVLLGAKWVHNFEISSLEFIMPN